MMGRSTIPLLLLLPLLLLAVAVSAKDTSIHGGHSHGASHAEIEAELLDVRGFTCTLTGAAGQDQCDAANDDDGSGCVWCVLNSFGFCVSEEQAAQFKQVMPTIDCDDDGGGSDDDDKAPPVPDNDDSPLWNCLESESREDCSSGQCVWCDTKGGFGVCLTPEGAALAKDSYWFDCPATAHMQQQQSDDDDDDDEASGEEGDDASAEEEGDYEDDEEEGDYDDDDDDDDEEDDEDDMNEFVVDTNCVMAAIVLDPNDDEVTSEQACFAARDVTGQPCEWCAVAGSPFSLCLSTPQAQVAEYVGAACTGSDESFEPEDFDDSCIARHTTTDATADTSPLSKEGCWAHQDLDGNGCEWCNMMGVEVCLGGVQAELVEHWGATCVMDTEEHDLATEAIEQHLGYLLARKEARDKQQAPLEAQDGEEELDLSTLWLTSDPSCVVTTLRAAAEGEDEQEAACAKMMDAEGNPCSWCEMGTGFNMCLNDEQAEVAEFMGLACGPFEDEDDEEEAEDLYDFDPSCLMAMQNGPDEGTCVAAKDADGNKCEWCSYQSFSACLSPEQAGMVEPFGVSCDKTETRFAELPKVEQEKHELAPKDIDTSCLVNMDEQSCEASQDDIANKACEWCSLGSLGISGCMSADQADMAKPLGVTCNAAAAAAAAAEQQTQEQQPQVQDLPPDFWSCLSQSRSVDDCDETCTWCDVKGAQGGAGFCLSDPVADAVTNYSGDSYLDCTEPAEEEKVAAKTKPNLGDIIVEAMEDSIA